MFSPFLITKFKVIMLQAFFTLQMIKLHFPNTDTKGTERSVCITEVSIIIEITISGTNTAVHNGEVFLL